MKNFFIFILTFFVLSGCTPLEVKKIPTNASSKVAVSAALPNSLNIQTIGTTIFNNKYMQGKLSGNGLSARVRTQIENTISGSGKSTVLRSNGSLDIPVGNVKRSLWSGALEIKGKEQLISKAKQLGADYLVLVANDDRQEPFYGSNNFINGIGVVQRSILGMTRSNSHAILSLVAFDTKSSQIVSEGGIYTHHTRAGKPWISPTRLPTAAEADEILSELKVSEKIAEKLTEMGLR